MGDRTNAAVLLFSDLQPTAYSLPSDRETLAAAALAFYIRIAKAEGLIQTLLDEIDLSAVNETQALLIHNDFHALIFEDYVIRADFIGVIHDVSETGATRLLDT